MQLLEKHIVEELENKVRFQEYGVGIFKTIPTKSAIKKAIKIKQVLDGNCNFLCISWLNHDFITDGYRVFYGF